MALARRAEAGRGSALDPYGLGMGEAEVLDGGNTSGEVVRVGDTVRKPWLATTARVVAFMETLRETGIDVPGTHGRDDQGRLVLDFVPGTMAIDIAPLGLDVVRRVGI